MIELLQINPEQRRELDILFLAKYAEDWNEPPPAVHPLYGRELYTKFEVLSVLRGLARSVEPCASLESFEERMRRGPAPDYVFQIYNREAVRIQVVHGRAPRDPPQLVANAVLDGLSKVGPKRTVAPGLEDGDP